MQKLSEEQILERDAKRDLNAELLESIKDLKAGKVGQVLVVTRTGQVIESLATRARAKLKSTESSKAKPMLNYALALLGN